jgi:hypothetical protein
LLRSFIYLLGNRVSPEKRREVRRGMEKTVTMAAVIREAPDTTGLVIRFKVPERWLSTISRLFYNWDKCDEVWLGSKRVK